MISDSEPATRDSEPATRDTEPATRDTEPTAEDNSKSSCHVFKIIADMFVRFEY